MEFRNSASSSINLNLSSGQMLENQGSNTISLLPEIGSGRGATGVSSHRILIVEDEAKLLSHLASTIAEEGFSIFTCSSFGELANLLKIPIKRFEVIVLDRLLHGKDSAELVSRIKETLPEVKILILSAINSASEKAALLDLGADDYLAKPFGNDELIARIRVLLRRSGPELKLGNVILNTEKRTVRIGEREIALQNKEFALLRTLIRTPGKIYNKIFLYEHVWEMSTEVESNVVEATVNKLRRRLEEAGAKVVIKSMRNKGYWVEE